MGRRCYASRRDLSICFTGLRNCLIIKAMKILIVEDDLPLAEGLAGALKGAGYDVLHVANGQGALEACRAQRFAVVILDLGLPDMSGFEVLSKIERARQGAVLILTALDGVEERVRGLDLGADDYMVKPFALVELEARVRALLRRTESGDDSRIQMGRLCVDLAGKRAWIGEAALDLTAREWGVLVQLLRRTGAVVSKQQLQNAIQSWDEVLSDNAIEVYVSRLRAKLQGCGVEIRTLRGFGYMIDEPKNAA